MRFAILIVLVACGSGEPAPASPPGAPTNGASAGEEAESATNDGWKRFAYDDQASVLTPAQPEVIADTDGQGYIASHEGVGYFIACGDVPGGGEDPVAVEARAGDDPGAHLMHQIEHLLVAGVGVLGDAVQLERLGGAAAALVEGGHEAGPGGDLVGLLGVDAHR